MIGEIGQFDGTNNETIEIQKVIKKRKVIITRMADGKEIKTVLEDDEEIPAGHLVATHVYDSPEFERQIERTTIVRTRRVIITKNEFGDDVETVVEDDSEPVDLQVRYYHINKHNLDIFV